jgi:hypothetical protein
MEEENDIKEWELEAMWHVQKLLTMSINDILNVHALRLIRRKFGFSCKAFGSL